MVYCGKASLNCKNCRVRRIKCNRLEPECSQCLRAGKKCPGYRDQLALMFRDETVKLKRKFDAPLPYQPRTDPSSSSVSSSASASSASAASAEQEQEQEPEPSSTARASPRTPTDDGRWSASSSNASTSSSTSSGSLVLSGEHAHWHRQRAAAAAAAAVAAASALVPAPARTPGDRGLQFYLDHYLYGHPESPGGADAVRADVAADIPWIFHPPARTLAEAVGMEGLANLTGDGALKMAAWQGYVAGLRQTAESLAHASPRAFAGDVRSIVLLAMFEMVRGSEPFGTANVHILGAAALMSKFVPLLPPSPQLHRGLMQMCYSLLIAYHATGAPVPPVVPGFVAALRIDSEDEQRMAALLADLVAVVNLSAQLRRRVLVDGRPEAAATAAQLLQLDARLAAWEASVQGRPRWQFETFHTAALPPDACYRGVFHRYYDVPTARIWGYYRWARILLEEMLLAVLDQCPRAVAGVLRTGGPDADADADANTDAADDAHPLAGLRRHALAVIRVCADATWASTPTHWRHPRVRAAVHAAVGSPTFATSTAGGSGAGSGAVGVFPILFHLQVAACAPGTPRAAWQWALGVVDTVWAQLGLEQARFLGSQMRRHRDALDRREQLQLQQQQEQQRLLCSPNG